MERRIILKNSLTELDRLAEAVEEFVEECALPMKAVFETNLVLEEVVTNVISYGYEHGGEHLIRIDLRWEQPQLTIQITDDGAPFNPLELPPPDLDQSVEERDIGGLGIYFVRQLMTEAAYERQAEKNILTLRKFWPEPDMPDGGEEGSVPDNG
ncbi:MAG TPA: ATP-binding protein [Patescibacteria group bacterium]|nr:ATP-binding protein [Patescibacteria group bacterium]